jgi:hypothetical protein
MAYVFKKRGAGDMAALLAAGGHPKLTTTERNATTTDAAAITASKITAGQVIYNSTTNKLNFWNGTAWEVVTSA